jgi:hypothetical protein
MDLNMPDDSHGSSMKSTKKDLLSLTGEELFLLRPLRLW